MKNHLCFPISVMALLVCFTGGLSATDGLARGSKPEPEQWLYSANLPAHCKFTLEDVIPRGDRESVIAKVSVPALPPRLTIKGVVAFLGKYLIGYTVYQDSKRPHVIHIVASVLCRWRAYPLGQKLTGIIRITTPSQVVLPARLVGLRFFLSGPVVQGGPAAAKPFRPINIHVRGATLRDVLTCRLHYRQPYGLVGENALLWSAFAQLGAHGRPTGRVDIFSSGLPQKAPKPPAATSEK